MDGLGSLAWAASTGSQKCTLRCYFGHIIVLRSLLGQWMFLCKSVQTVVSHPTLGAFWTHSLCLSCVCFSSDRKILWHRVLWGPRPHVQFILRSLVPWKMKRRCPVVDAWFRDCRHAGPWEILCCWAGFLEHIHMLMLELVHTHTRDVGFVLSPYFLLSSTLHKCLCFVQPPTAFANFSWARGGQFMNGEGARVQMCLPLSLRLTLAKASGTSVGCFKPRSDRSWAQELCCLADQAC